MTLKNCLTLLLLGLALSSHAQVHRCVDAAGKTSFSDQPCPIGAKSAARVLGSDATDRRWENEVYGRERNMRSIENASRIIQEPTSDARGDAGGGIINNGPDGPGGTNTIRAEEDQRRAELALDAARRRAAAEAARQAAPQLASCDRAGCWDTNGARYNRVAGGNLLGPDGRFCVRAGNTFSCN